MFPPLMVKMILPGLVKKIRNLSLNLCFNCFAKELGEEHVTCLSDKHFAWSHLIFHAKTQENTFRVISQCFFAKTCGKTVSLNPMLFLMLNSGSLAIACSVWQANVKNVGTYRKMGVNV